MNQFINNLRCESAINHIANGEVSAISIIFDLMHKKIYSVSWAILRNQSDAEDCLQNTLCEIMRCATAYTRGNATAWILKIAHNQALNLLHTKNKTLPNDTLETQTCMEIPPSTMDSSVQCFEALSLLTDPERQIVVMKVYVGLKHKEIASLLNLTTSATEKKYQRAMQKLKNYYQQGGSSHAEFYDSK